MHLSNLFSVSVLEMVIFQDSGIYS